MKIGNIEMQFAPLSGKISKRAMYGVYNSRLYHLVAEYEINIK